MRSQVLRTPLSRRRFALCAGALSISAVAGLFACQTGAVTFDAGHRVRKTARVGVLNVGDPTEPQQVVLMQTFNTRMRELGWIEGQNLIVEVRSGGGVIDPENFAALSAELLQLPVDVFV